MNRVLEQIRAFFGARTPREQWILALLGVAAVLGLVYFGGIRRVQRSLGVERAQVAGLRVDLEKSVRLARNVSPLRAALEQVEERITPGEKTNLFTLLETLAEQADVKKQLESIKPKQPSGNQRYPETRVEVSLRGASLTQIVEFLYRIESANSHLIVRSVRIKSRSDDTGLLDVSLSVSSFERT